MDENPYTAPTEVKATIPSEPWTRTIGWLLLEVVQAANVAGIIVLLICFILSLAVILFRLGII